MGGVEGVNGNGSGAWGCTRSQESLPTNSRINLYSLVGSGLVTEEMWEIKMSRMIERYVYGLAPQIHGMVAAMKPKSIQKAVQISEELGLLMLLILCEPCRKSEYGLLGQDTTALPTMNRWTLSHMACYEYGSTDHVRPACPRLNRARGPEENRPNQVAANNRGQGRGNQGNQARGRAFMLGAEEARQDPNIMTGLEPTELGFNMRLR
ncbi:hypothetical protein Tco_1318686 [Tanacetum coccineum]